MNCRSCGFSAGIFNLRVGLCKSCRTGGKTENKSKLSGNTSHKNSGGGFSCINCGYEAGLLNLVDGLCRSCINANGNATEYSKNNTKEKSKKEDEKIKNKKSHRVFSCPICKLKIRVALPIPNGVGRCITCDSRFTVYADNQGHLYIEAVNENKSSPDDDAISSINDCFILFGLSGTATRQDIKKAYRKKMMEYHPDKVSVLGSKIRVLAEMETKKLNYAIAILKESGYV